MIFNHAIPKNFFYFYWIEVKHEKLHEQGHPNVIGGGTVEE
jgi:hypothetical protein